MISYILAVVTGIVMLGIDQYTKYLVVANCRLAQTYPLLPGVMDITYIHNRGGAWGMLSGYTWLLISVTLVIMLICIAMLLKLGFKNRLIFWAIILVLSGGIGNMIDRIFRGGNVVDFLHFSFFPQFPVFNIADCCVTIGAGLLLLYFLLGMIEEGRAKKRSAFTGETETHAED